LEKEVFVPIELESGWALGLVWAFWRSRGIAGVGRMAPLPQAADSKGEQSEYFERKNW